MKALNINSELRIKLTPYGIEKIKKQYGEFYFNTFGEDMYINNMNLPFETNIEIDDAKLWSL